MAAISESMGLICYETRLKSIKKEDFLEFIDKLRPLIKPRKSVLFLDNSSVHRSKLVCNRLKKMRLKVQWNLPYRPELNAIELYWALAKAKYRKDLLRAMIDSDHIDFENLVVGSLESVPNSKI